MRNLWILFCLVLLNNSSLKAQLFQNEFYIGYNVIMPAESDSNTGILAPPKFKAPSILTNGPILIGYNRHLNRTFSIGGLFSMPLTSPHNFSSNPLLFLAKFNTNITTGKWKLYCGGSIGIPLLNKEMLVNESLAAHLHAGLKVGWDVAPFIEFGSGANGRLNVGLSYNF